MAMSCTQNGRLQTAKQSVTEYSWGVGGGEENQEGGGWMTWK
jgi:hypothetical protein